jgi:hypothetical protein
MNAVALAALLLAGGLQDESEARFTAPKQERSIYLKARETFRLAEEQLLTDPLQCVKQCDGLLDDKYPRDIHRDLMLRIQNTDGSYGDWTLFAPFQLRGRAHLARAESLKSSNRKEAASQARLAVIDLDASVRQKVKSSEDPLKRAEKLANELKDAEPAVDERLVKAERRMADLQKLVDQNPAPELLLQECKAVAAEVQGTPFKGALDSIRATSFEKCWSAPAVAGRFRSARASVETFGDFLSEDERKKVLARIEEKFLDAVRRFHAEVRGLLPDQDTWTAFLRVPAGEVEARLGAPPADELDVVDRKCREQVIRMRARTALLDATLDEFLQALSLTAATCVESASRPDAFAGLEALVQDLARRRLEKNLSGAFDDESTGLQRRREEAQRIMDAGRPAVLSKHLEQLRSLVNGLPIDPARLDDIGRELLDPANGQGLWGRTPKLAEKLEKELAEMNRSEGARLSRDARRKLATYLLVSQVARMLLAGSTTDDLAATSDLRSVARDLEMVGGPLPEVVNLISPRVRDVLALLKRP